MQELQVRTSTVSELVVSWTFTAYITCSEATILLPWFHGDHSALTINNNQERPPYLSDTQVRTPFWHIAVSTGPYPLHKCLQLVPPLSCVCVCVGMVSTTCHTIALHHHLERADSGKHHAETQKLRQNRYNSVSGHSNYITNIHKVQEGLCIRKYRQPCTQMCKSLSVISRNATGVYFLSCCTTVKQVFVSNKRVKMLTLLFQV